jgi:flagellar hook-associated protein 1 FlgK
MSTFSGLTAALTALHGHRRSMEVASQNIANASTPGYSRQRVDLQAIGGPVIPGIFAQSPGVGSGVSITDVQRIRDMFLESRVRTEVGQNEYLVGKQLVLGRLEQTFGEPSDTGIQAQLSELWTSFADLANRPGDPAARTAVLKRAQIVADSFNSTAEGLGSLWLNSREQLDTVVSDINTIAATVAQLNKAVVAAKAAGQPANELADQRDVQVMKLAELAGVRGVAREDGSVDVLLGSAALVRGATSRQVSLDGAPRLADQAANPLALTFVDNGQPAEAGGGRLAATMEMLQVTLPGYRDGLDVVAQSLRTAVNAQHAAGVDSNGDAGGLFFSGDTAELLRVVITDPADIAAATAGSGPLDGTNADALADLAFPSADKLDELGIDDGPDRRYRQMVVDLGVLTQTVNRRQGIQQAVLQEVEAARSSDSGVNLDEEMTNMVAFERAYQAAARVISTVDEMLDTLINRMAA